MNFHGVKIALFVDGKLLVYLRDNRPDLFNANMWDFFGGGREGEETPCECVIREVLEELGIILTKKDIVWEKAYPAQKDPTAVAYFMVAEVETDRFKDVVLNEGQRLAYMDVEEFLTRSDVVEALKVRLSDYLSLK